MPKIETPVSILILGKGGEGHEAPDLTDTIILAYLNSESKTISLFPLPRDIWVPEIRAKINSAYYWGKQKNEGFKLVDESVKRITGQDVNYNLVLDFSIFKEVVDAIGGVEVDVENSFTDNKFPVVGLENDPCIQCRYKTLSFTKGKQKMDGETALNFVRSRNSQGDEGTDIAREVRQQRALSAIKSKLTSSKFFLNSKSILAFKNAILGNIETDIDFKSMLILGKLAIDSKDNFKNLTIPLNLIQISNKSPKYDNQYVILPKNGNWVEFQRWLNYSIK
ncbi:MAG: LCP family protein [Patescibacteria group bacterium]